MKKTLAGLMAIVLCAGMNISSSALEDMEDTMPVAGEMLVDSSHIAEPPAAKTWTEEEIAAYADNVFDIINRERKKAGVAPLVRNVSLNKGALTRAEECASLNSIYINGKSHIRPDGSKWYTVFGIKTNTSYGENTGQGGDSATVIMEHFMASAGHKKNILRQDYTGIGVGCAVSSEGEIFTVQIFYRPKKVR